MKEVSRESKFLFVGAGNITRFVGPAFVSYEHEVGVISEEEPSKPLPYRMKWLGEDAYEHVNDYDVVVLGVPYEAYGEVATKIVKHVDPEKQLVAWGVTSALGPAQQLRDIFGGIVRFGNSHILGGKPSNKTFFDRGLGTVFDPQSYEETGDLIKLLLGYGLDVFQREPEIHDRAMAIQQAVGSIFALAIHDLVDWDSKDIPDAIEVDALRNICEIADKDSGLFRTFMSTQQAVDAVERAVISIQSLKPLYGIDEYSAFDKISQKVGYSPVYANIAGVVMKQLGLDQLERDEPKLIIPSGDRLMIPMRMVVGYPSLVEVQLTFGHAGDDEAAVFIAAFERRASEAFKHARKVGGLTVPALL